MKRKLKPLLANSFLFLTLVSLTGCGLRTSVWRQSSIALSHEERSRVHDLPFPLHVKPTKLLFTQEQMVLSFVTDLMVEELIKDYRAQMEYCGWQEIGSVEAAESCLIFIKPRKVCTVSIRPEGSQRRVVLFSTIKQ